jgi:hypothetical protein
MEYEEGFREDRVNEIEEIKQFKGQLRIRSELQTSSWFLF